MAVTEEIYKKTSSVCPLSSLAFTGRQSPSLSPTRKLGVWRYRDCCFVHLDYGTCGFLSHLLTCYPRYHRLCPSASARRLTQLVLLYYYASCTSFSDRQKTGLQVHHPDVCLQFHAKSAMVPTGQTSISRPSAPEGHRPQTANRMRFQSNDSAVASTHRGGNTRPCVLATYRSGASRMQFSQDQLAHI